MKTFFNRRSVVLLLWIPGVTAAGFALYAWKSTIPAIDPPAAATFDSSTISRGGQLAALGDCASCHTATNGESFAGGRPLRTPFGTVFSTNITPDAETGIGRWSEQAFSRSLREGVGRDGRHLYPAFPYEHFTLLSDADSAALYAFMMTRRPVQARPPANQLPFPLNLRFVLAGWKLLFLRQGPYQPQATHDEQWNRGAYLANGIGHCGACHTPRNDLGAEVRSEQFAGGEADGWNAYAINSKSAAYEPWNAAALHTYLRQGWHERHGDAYGPMAPVVHNLGAAADEDVRAIAAYVAWMMGTPSIVPEHPQTAASESTNHETGASIFAAACADCHDGSRALPYGGIKLTLSTAVTGESATNLINVILDGLHPAEADSGAFMPGFASALTDGQLESLLTYVRSDLGGRPPWTGLESSVRQSRSRERD